MTSVFAAACAVLGAGAAALGQFAGGVNIDFNSAVGSGAGQPTVLFPGAAGQGGYWNPVNPPFTHLSSRAIRNLGNSADAVFCLFLTSAGGTGTASADNPATSGDAELLFDDVHNLGGTGSTVTYSIGAFAPGVYEVYTYAVAPDDAAYLTRIGVRTNGDGAAADRVVGGVIPAGGVLTEGVTHARHTVVLSAAGPLIIDAATHASFGSVNGVQIRRLAPTRLYVRPSLGVVGTGLSWASPLATLQRALAVARTTPSVTEVWVERGVHLTDRYPAAAGDRAAEFVVPAGVTVYGGFAGTEATPAERPDAAASGNQTVLSGAIGGAAATDNALRVARCSAAAGGGAGTVTLDGVVIEGAYSDIDGDPYIQGGAVLAGEASVVMRRCVVRECTSGDAAVAVSAGRTGEMTDCLLERNASPRTTAVQSSGAVTMERCVVRDHRMSGAYLGSLVSSLTGSLTMTNCLVHDNNRHSHPSAGMFMLVVGQFGASATVTLRNCTFANNTGGGVHIGSFGAQRGTLVVRNSVLWGNRRPQEPAWTLEEHQIDTYGEPALDILDSIVEGWTGALGAAGDACFSGNPHFADADGADNVPGSADDNYRLAAFSPARDSGWNSGTPLAVTTDLSGQPRRVDDLAMANSGFGGGWIDRGCYEAGISSAACPGDIGRTGGLPGADGFRDNNDFVVFIDWFFGHDSRADCGRVGGVAGPDGVFDNNDFVAYIDLFFSACP